MNSSPKILVVKMREIIYTILLLFLIVLLILCLILMFSKKKDSSSRLKQTDSSESIGTRQSESSNTSEKNYTPGIYTSPISLGESTVDVEVTVNSDQITSIRLVNLSESVAASYPLVSPSLAHISSQILEKQNLEEITSPQENRYTSQLLLSAISDALDLARNTL